jgi:branched-chain amino acid transport system substrate-binding protein
MACLLFILPACQSAAMPPLPVTPNTPALEIAVLSPTCGEFQPLGQPMRNGIELALDEWDQQGGAAGQRLTWRLYDTGCTFAEGQQAARQAIAEGHQFMLGPLCTEAAIAAAAEAEAAGVVLIAPASPQPLVTVNPQGQPRPTVFGMVVTPDTQGKQAATFAIDELGTATAAILTPPNDDYSLALAQAFARQFIALGGQLVYQAELAADNSAPLLAAQHAGAALIYLPAAPATANEVLSHRQGVTLPVLGDDRWDSSQLDRALAEGSYFPRHVNLTGSNPNFAAWAKSYQAIYATAPGPLAALGFESAQVLAQAINQSGRVVPLTVAKTLARHPFNGLAGEITFTPVHNRRTVMSFVQVKAGQLQPLPQLNSP